MDNRRRWFVRLFLVSGILMIATAVHAQLIGTVTVTDALSILMSGGDPLADVDPATYAAEAPGLGHKFFLFGNAQDTVDPENEYNDVISVDTAAPPTFGGAERKLGVKIGYLTNQIQLKYFFVPPHTCGVGTPRVFLTVDTDGDGHSNGNAFGYIGVPPAFGACPQGEWVFENLTDNLTRWDLTQFGGPFYNTWAQVVAFFSAFPTHEVLTGGVVDDTSNPIVGSVYFDVFTVGNRTLENREDTVQ